MNKLVAQRLQDALVSPAALEERAQFLDSGAEVRPTGDREQPPEGNLHLRHEELQRLPVLIAGWRILATS